MNTNLKVILTAISIATLASPVMAQSLTTRPYVAASAANISNAHGSVSGARRARVAPVTERNQIQIDDAVHVQFPQQGGTGN